MALITSTLAVCLGASLLAARPARSHGRKTRPGLGPRAAAHYSLIERACGLILVGTGVLPFTGHLSVVNSWAIRTFGLGLAL